MVFCREDSNFTCFSLTDVRFPFPSLVLLVAISNAFEFGLVAGESFLLWFGVQGFYGGWGASRQVFSCVALAVLELGSIDQTDFERREVHLPPPPTTAQLGFRL